MIVYSHEKEKSILLEYARKYSLPKVERIILDEGMKSAEDVKAIAELYWRIVDDAEGENIEYWLEKIYTTLHIHAGNQGFEDVWDAQMP